MTPNFGEKGCEITMFKNPKMAPGVEIDEMMQKNSF